MLLHKVLWQNKSRLQILGASVGVSVGMFLLLLSLQFYFDMGVLMRGARDANLLIINKEMNVLNTLGAPNDFKAEEIEELRQKPFVKSLGAFTSNRFRAALESDALRFYTLLFLQSVPNEFLGIDTSKFTWQDGEKVPLVLSSDYLSLYNYGFAPSQNLPPFTLATISKVTGDLTLKGNGKIRTFKTSIVDLSPNINSILVPKSFMDYANAEFGDKEQLPTQLVFSTDNPYNNELNNFLKDKNYQISRGGLIGGELKTVLDILLLFISLISVIIIGLSMLVFILNFQLLVAQSSQNIQLLLQIGYPDGRITSTLARSLVALFISVSVLSFVALIPIKYLVSQSLIAQGYANLSLFPHWLVWLVGVFFCFFFILINWRSIQKSVRNLG
jgi:hypothetical protein